MKQKEIVIENKTIFKWWFIYLLLGGIAGTAAGVLLGIFGGFVGMNELIMLLISIPILSFINFIIFRWSIKKMLV